MLEPQPRQPDPIRARPGFLAVVNPAVSQQKPAQLLAAAAHRLHRGQTRTHQIAHRLVRRIRHPDRAQFTRTMQLRQAQRIVPV